MRLADAALCLLLATSIPPGVLGSSSPPPKKIASGHGIHNIDRFSNIPSLSSGRSSSPTPESGIIGYILNEHNVSTCKEFVENAFSKSEEKSGDNYIPPPNDVTIPIPIRGKDEALDKFKSMLPITKAFLYRNGRAPRDNNEMEKDNWDTLSVLGYSLVERLYPLVKSKCDNGKFHCRTIDQLKVGGELRGTYRLYDIINNIVKTGLSNEVMGGIIERTLKQLTDKELDDDEEADEEDKKGITVTEAKKILVKNHKEDVAFYFTVDEQMEMVKGDEVIMEILNAIGVLAPAFAGWDESLSEKRNQEILNYGFEAVCACSFSGSKFHNVMEMFFTLGSTTLREMIELPEKNQLVVELLRSRRLTPEQIKCIFTWGTSTTAVREKGVELRADTDNSSNNKTGHGVSDMIRDFHPDDPASFLQLLENQIIFCSKSISYENAFPSQSYAQVVTAARDIPSVLESSSAINKQDEIITHVQTLCGLDRYDDPKGSNAYVTAVNDKLAKVKQEDNSGMLVIENTMKKASKFDTIFPAYKNTYDIKNADGTVAGNILFDNNDSSPLILALPSLHLMRGVKVTDKQRFVARQAQLSIMKCLYDAGIVSDTALETQQKAAYSQLLWTEGIGDNDAKEVMSDKSDINMCDGSSEKGRMVVLGSLCRITSVKEGVDFIGKLMSGKYVFDADSNPSLGKNVTENSIDNVIVACLVAEIGLDNFARMMDIGYGINSDVAGVDFLKEGTSFSNNWLCLKHRLECGNKVQQRWEGAGEDDGSDDELPPHNFD